MNYPGNIRKDISFEEVYDTNYDCIYKYAYSLLLNKEDAEDVTADTFLAAFDNFDRYDPALASVRTWLTRIAHNRAVNLRRSAAFVRRADMPEKWELSSTEDASGQIEASDIVLRLYAHLSQEERELLNLRYVMELKDNEIGDLLNLPGKTVNKRIQRLLQKCRLILINDEEIQCL